MTDRLVIVGNGMASTRLVERIGHHAPGQFAVTVIGAEPRPAYNRVLLSSLLAGEIDHTELELKPPHWWWSQANVVSGVRVVTIDRVGKTVTTEAGETIGYDHLVLATGSQAIRLPKPGMDLPGVITFRDVADADALMRTGGHGRRAVVIGGGLLGLEAANGLAKSGAAVTLVHIMDRLMERQLDAPAAALLAQAVQARGIALRLSTDTARVLGTTQAEGIETTAGEMLSADLVVCAVGIRPETALAKAAGLTIARGIVVDDAMRTDDDSIFALGECAEHRGTAYGLVEPAYEQADILARTLAGAPAAYAGTMLATNLKISGLGVFSAGDFSGCDGDEPIVFSDPDAGIYRKLVLRGAEASCVLAGAVLVGDTGDALWYRDLIRDATPIAALRHTLAFGRPAPLAA